MLCRASHAASSASVAGSGASHSPWVTSVWWWARAARSENASHSSSMEVSWVPHASLIAVRPLGMGLLEQLPLISRLTTHHSRSGKVRECLVGGSGGRDAREVGLGGEMQGGAPQRTRGYRAPRSEGSPRRARRRPSCTTRARPRGTGSRTSFRLAWRECVNRRTVRWCAASERRRCGRRGRCEGASRRTPRPRPRSHRTEIPPAPPSGESALLGCRGFEPPYAARVHRGHSSLPARHRQ